MEKVVRYLNSFCKVQVWIKEQINKPIQEVEKINPHSITSVKQRLITKK